MTYHDIDGPSTFNPEPSATAAFYVDLATPSPMAPG